MILWKPFWTTCLLGDNSPRASCISAYLIKGINRFAFQTLFRDACIIKSLRRYSICLQSRGQICLFSRIAMITSLSRAGLISPLSKIGISKTWISSLHVQASFGCHCITLWKLGLGETSTSYLMLTTAYCCPLSFVFDLGVQSFHIHKRQKMALVPEKFYVVTLSLRISSLLTPQQVGERGQSGDQRLIMIRLLKPVWRLRYIIHVKH